MSTTPSAPWISVAAFCTKYRIERKTVYRLIRQGKIQAQQLKATGKTGKSDYRVPDDASMLAPKWANTEEAVDNTPMFRTGEAAFILGISRHTVRYLINQNKLTYSKRNGQLVFSVMDLSKRLAAKLKPPKRQGLSGQAIRYGICLWAAARIAEKLKADKPPDVEVTPSFAEMQQMIDVIGNLPAEEREKEFALWWKRLHYQLQIVNRKRRVS